MFLSGVLKISSSGVEGSIMLEDAWGLGGSSAAHEFLTLLLEILRVLNRQISPAPGSTFRVRLQCSLWPKLRHEANVWKKAAWVSGTRCASQGATPRRSFLLRTTFLSCLWHSIMGFRESTTVELHGSTEGSAHQRYQPNLRSS